MASDDLLADAILDVLDEVPDGTVFGAGEVLRALRPVLPGAQIDEVREMLDLFALPMLGGVIAVEHGYRTGVSSDVVVDRLRKLTTAVRQVDDEELADRY